MRYDNQAGVMLMSVGELATYAYQRENHSILIKKFGFVREITDCSYPDDGEKPAYSPARLGVMLHNSLETDSVDSAEDVDSVRTEVPLERTIAVGEYAVTIQGFADIISYDGHIHTVEEIKTVRRIDGALSPFSDPSHFAQAAIYAHLLAESVGISEIMVKLSYVKRSGHSGGEKVSFTAKFTRAALSKMFDALIERAALFIKIEAERYTVFPKEVEKMPFPYRSIREGQAEFIHEAYRAITHGYPLLVSAPTGIGKTISAVYPSIKAAGSGRIDRIFYLTAKNITGAAAMDACCNISKFVPHFRAVMIQAKEQVCPLKKDSPDLNLRAKCRFCEQITGISSDFGKTSVSYRERELSALSELLSQTDTIFTIAKIKAAAKKFSVCPYELSLDLSEFCTMIVCDYNYVIDDKIRFRRYFRDMTHAGEKYVFLFDEAHNLPDRARNTYSAIVTSKLADEISELSKTYFPDDERLIAMSGAFSAAMRAVCESCTDNEYVRTVGDRDITYGYTESDRIPDSLVKSATDLSNLIGRYLRDGTDNSELLADAYTSLSKLTFAAGYFDSKFRFFASRENDSATAEVLCIDPSGVIGAMLSPAKSSILFSATLSPIDYFSEVTGLSTAVTLELESPYERDNLCLVAFDSVSTRFSDRRGSAEDCAEVIAETVSARCGNYIVYFPSYDYMKRVCRLFSQIMPECGLVVQRQGMSYRERERFIELFHKNAGSDDSWVVGFCVLGGMFSEGIDLSGESLIGAVVVGIGMPQLSAERNIMAAYYDEKNERGYDFAYLCPGMNKVLQAAGRVIRSENDRGVVVLIDDRLGEPAMKLKFPRHWRHMKYTGNLESLHAILDEFWER